MKNVNDTFGNRTRDFMVGSAVPQSTAPTPTPRLAGIMQLCAKHGFDVSFLWDAAVQNEPCSKIVTVSDTKMGFVKQYYKHYRFTCKICKMDN